MSVVVGHAHGQKPHATTSPVCAEVCVVDVQTEPSCRGCSVECFAFENRDAGRRVRMCQQQNVYQNNIDSIEPMWRAMSFRKAMDRTLGNMRGGGKCAVQRGMHDPLLVIPIHVLVLWYTLSVRSSFELPNM